MIRAALGLSIVLCTSTALADEASARKKYDAAERAYNLGEFEKAIALFKEAYADSPEPAFLFNLAQTYRQTGDCKQALFFYKRFLALKSQDTKKPIRPELKSEVEKRIVELEECMRRELASKPPDTLDNGTTSTTTTPPKTTTTATTDTTAQVDQQTDEVDEEEEDEEEDVSAAADAQQPTMISTRLDAGAAKLSAGDLNTATQLTLALAGGYPLTVAPQVQLELGVAALFTPVPYKTGAGMDGSGTMFGVLANVAPSYAFTPKLAARLDVGAGLLVFSGLGMDGNPFTVNGAPASGALSSFLVRVAASADFAVTPNIVITATPIAFSYSPAPTGFKDTIPTLTTLSFLVGVGYRR